jgi:hypothetical protein
MGNNTQESNAATVITSFPAPLKRKVISGGSTDIVPEPGGKQNGTAPLQNDFLRAKIQRNYLTLQTL